MNITVQKDGASYIADWGVGARICAVGRTGIGKKEKEGDGLTPQGAWPLRRVFYRADKLAPPKTILPRAPTTPADGWCDAPGDPKYNQLVRLPYPASAEHMWHQDSLYDVVVVVGFNDSPVIQGAGSAIFLHIATPDYAPTAGCVALRKEDLLEALAQWCEGDNVEIMAPL